MPSSSDIQRVYGPGDLQAMTAAYEKAHQRLPKRFQESETARRKLALLIFRAVNRGERDPEHIADLATLGFFR
jgi:hypothetical protein